MAKRTASSQGRQVQPGQPKASEAISGRKPDLQAQVQPERGLVTQANSGNNLFTGGKVAMVMRGVARPTTPPQRQDFKWDVAPIPGNVKQMQEGADLLHDHQAGQDPGRRLGSCSSSWVGGWGQIFAETKWRAGAQKPVTSSG
jgi:hypothetical protein